MVDLVADRVQETTTTSGTGAITPAGAVSGCRTFASVCSNGTTFPYTIFDPATGAWEVGRGTWNTGNTISRTVVQASSNAGAAVSFAGNVGTTIFLTCSASYLNALVNTFLQGVPVSSNGLPSGSIWRDGTILRITGAAPAVAPIDTAFYVATNGLDTNAGTSAALPFLTIGKAITMMTGATKKTYVRGGTYNITTALALTSSHNGVNISNYPGESPVITASTVANHMTMVGASNVTLKGIVFQNNLSGTANASLSMSASANSNSIIACRFTGVQQAILMAGSSGNFISGNQVDAWTLCGIEFKDLSNNNVFDSNLIDGSGATGTTTANGAFYGHGVSNCVISHNLVRNMPGTGIGILDFSNPGVSTTQNTANAIRYNAVMNTCKTATDNGAIYMLGRAQFNTQAVIEYNLVDTCTNISLANQHCVGIYLDDETNGAYVRGNIVRGVQDNCVQYHGGLNNTVVNNVLDMGSGGCTAVLFQAASWSGNTQSMTGNVFQNNICYSTSAAPTVIKNFSGGTFTDTANLYYNTLGASMTTNSDTAPVYGNPAFTNAAAGDYSLQTTTAANGIGFPILPSSQIGLNPTTEHWY